MLGDDVGIERPAWFYDAADRNDGDVDAVAGQFLVQRESQAAQRGFARCQRGIGRVGFEGQAAAGEEDRAAAPFAHIRHNGLSRDHCALDVDLELFEQALRRQVQGALFSQHGGIVDQHGGRAEPCREPANRRPQRARVAGLRRHPRRHIAIGLQGPDPSAEGFGIAGHQGEAHATCAEPPGQRHPQSGPGADDQAVRHGNLLCLIINY